MAELTEVLLVSCELVEEYGIDEENVLLTNELSKRGIKSQKVVWEDPTINWGETSLARAVCEIYM